MANLSAVFFILVVSVVGFSFASASQKPTIEESNDITTETTPQAEESTLPVLSRKRRYIIFPKGSSIQCIFCETSRGYVPLTKRFTMGITLGLAWMLPTEAHELYLQKRDADLTMAAMAQAGYGVQHRADMYKMLEGFLSLKGLKGRDCLMRAVCEASQSRQNQTASEENLQGTFMEELHKILFTLPAHPKHQTPYDEARDHAGKCGEIYSGCQSFLNIAL